MNSMKWISLIVPAALLIASCSENTAKNNAEMKEGSVMLRGVTSSMFDMPSSISNESATVDVAGQNSNLAKAVAVAAGEEEDALGFYKAVPATIYFADAIKDSVRLLIEKFAATDLPESYEGTWDDYAVKLVSLDSLGSEEEGELFRLTMSKNGEIVMNLQYRKNNRDQYRGSCYFKSQDADSTKLLLRFNTFNEGTLGKRMTIWITRPASTVEEQNDATAFRFRAVQTPAGRIVLSGMSYHPDFDGDDFWLDGAKIYGFRTVSDVEKDHAILRVAFADAADVGANFFVEHSLDKAVLSRATEIWKAEMLKNDTIAKAVTYSLEKEIPLSQIITSPVLVLAVWAYEPKKTVEEFTEVEMEAYLGVNAVDILAGEDEGMKLLYFHAKVKQPIYLSRGAKIVGYQSKEPADFAVGVQDFETEEFDSEVPADMDSFEITEEDAEEETTVESL